MKALALAVLMLPMCEQTETPKQKLTVCPKADLSGYYRVVGYEGTTKYTGIVAIIKLSPEHQGYVIRYLVIPSQVYAGILMPTDSGFVVSWRSGEAQGLCVFRKTCHGKYEGRWMSNPLRSDRETLTKIANLKGD